MPDDMLEDAILISRQHLDEHEFEANEVEVSISNLKNNRFFTWIQIARLIKVHMDTKWEPSWHVFLGKSFGCHAVHEKNRFVYFTFEHNKISFLIYKASWSGINLKRVHIEKN